MDDLYEMMEDPNVDAYEHESDYDQMMGDQFVEEDGGMTAQQFGLALGMAEMISDNNTMVDPAIVFEDFEESFEKISLKGRHDTSDVPVPAFEQYVYKKCGI